MKQNELDDIFGEIKDPEIEKKFHDALEDSDISGLDATQLESLLHELTARRLVEAMRRGDPGAGMIQAARGFLRDNNISGLPIPGTAVDELQKHLNKNAPFLKIAKEA